MYFNYGGFNENLVLKYNLDNDDLHILSYISWVASSENLEHFTENEKQYVWLNLKKIIEDNPRLRIKERMLEIRLSELTQKNMLEKVVRCQKGTKFKKTYYRITNEFRMMSFCNAGNNTMTLFDFDNSFKEEKDKIINEKEQIEEENIPYAEIIEYLNKKTNSAFRTTTRKTQTLIKARFNEKYTLNDFKKVIDIKVADWQYTDMAKYLVPETLFGNKFEKYLNQKSGNFKPSGRTNKDDEVF